MLFFYDSVSLCPPSSITPSLLLQPVQSSSLVNTIIQVKWGSEGEAGFLYTKLPFIILTRQSQQHQGYLP